MIQKKWRTIYKTFGKFNIFKSADPDEIYLRVPQRNQPGQTLQLLMIIFKNSFKTDTLEAHQISGFKIVKRWISEVMGTQTTKQTTTQVLGE